MDENDIVIKNKNDKWFKIIITELICVAIIIIAVLVTKYFFKSTYNNISKWYKENICVETDINEVLDNSDGGQDEV